VTVYVRLTDAEGHYRFKLKYVQTATGQALAEIEGEAEIKDRLGVADFYVTTPPLAFPTPGRYEIQVWFNDVLSAPRPWTRVAGAVAAGSRRRKRKG